MTVAVLRDILQTLNEACRRSPYELRRTITGVALTIVRVDKSRSPARQRAGRAKTGRCPFTIRTHNGHSTPTRSPCVRGIASIYQTVNPARNRPLLLPTSRRKRSPARHADCSYITSTKFLLTIVQSIA